MEAEVREMLRAQLVPQNSAADRDVAYAALQEMGRQWRERAGAPEGWSFTDQDVAERHLEGAWEDGRVSNEERRTWLERLNAFEVWPAELEAFISSRTL